MQDNQKTLLTASFSKLFITLSLPTIIIMLVTVIYNMADIFFIGQTGDPTKIAALSLCTPIFTTLSGLGTLLGSGGCTAISLALGNNDTITIKKYSSFCFYGSIVIGLIFTVVLILFKEQICLLLGGDISTINSAMTYLSIIALGAPVTIFASVFTNIIRSDGAAKQSMIANGLGTISNIILDAIFILVFKWDVAGAAIATVIGNIISSIYLLYYIKVKQHIFSLSIKDFTLKSDISIKVISLGLPLAVSTLLMSVSSAYANRLIANYGAIAIAAQGISGKIGMLLTMISMGICMGLQPAFSINYSKRNFKRLRYIIRCTALLTIVVGSILAIGCYLNRNVIIGMFIDNKEILEYGQIMVLGSICIAPIYGLYQLCQTFLQSSDKASYATFVAILDKGLVYIPVLLILSNIFDLYGIVFTSAVTLLISLLIGIILSIKWYKTVTSDTYYELKKCSLVNN